MKLQSIVIIIVSVSWIVVSAGADELVIGFAPEKPPFIFAGAPYSEKDYDIVHGRLGIQIDIVAVALEGTGYTFRPVYASNKRIIKNVRKKLYDAGEMTGHRYSDIFYSGSIIEFKNFAISRKSENLKINKIEDLSHLKVVAWQGAKDELGDAFAAVAKGNPSYYEHSSLKGQCMMFFSNHVEVIIVAKNIFLWWKKEIASTYDTTEELVYHPIFPGTNVYSMGFASKSVRDSFDNGLRRIKADGTYQEIFKSYLE